MDKLRPKSTLCLHTFRLHRHSSPAWSVDNALLELHYHAITSSGEEESLEFFRFNVDVAFCVGALAFCSDGGNDVGDAGVVSPKG